MKRLTKKYDDNSYGLEIVNCEVEKKLGQLEDIEQELGIDLITLFKAQTSLELFFIDLEKTNYGYIFSMPTSDCLFNLSNKTLHIRGDVEDYAFADYGKTWALTKEELK